MTVRDQVDTTATRSTTTGPRPWQLGLLGVALFAALGGAVANLHRGPEADWMRNPNPQGAAVVDGYIRAQPPLWGFDYWPQFWEILSVVVATWMWAHYIHRSRRDAWHPGLIAMVGATSMLWMDPLVNWSQYLIYDPRLLHLPVDWPWLHLAPTVEPIVFALFAYPFVFMTPGMIAVAVHRRFVLPRSRPNGLVRRHPLASLALLATLVGAAWDVPLELLLTRCGIYSYSQVIPELSIFGGTTHQFPLLIETPLIAVLFAVPALMMWPDDRGRTINHQLSERLRMRGDLSARLGPSLAAVLIISVAYTAFLVPWWAARALQWSDQVAQPYNNRDIKTYDPQGFYQRAGEPGPYFTGSLAGWPSGN